MSDIPAGQPGEEDLDLGEIVDDLEPEPDDLEPGVDDEEPEPDEGDPEPVAAAPQRRKGEAARYRERLERTERELAELKARPAPVAQPAYDPAAAQRAEAEFNASLDMMAPADAIRAIDQRRTAQFQQVLFNQQNQINDRLDKQAYDAEARTSRVHQQYRQFVEDQLVRERAIGNHGATRADILAWKVGKDAIERANRTAPRQQRAAAGRVSRQQVRPGSTRSDGAAGSRTRPDADEALLRGVRVGDL